MQGKWIEVKIITVSNAVEPVSGIFYGLDVKGVAIEDPEDFYSRKKDPTSWDFADINIFEYGDNAAVVKGYFSQEENIDEVITYIKKKLKELQDSGIYIGEGTVIKTEVHEEEWATTWKKYYKPTKLGEKIVVKPTWENYKPADEEIIIELDPGMAFGTGTHETTMMCVEMLEKYINQGDTVFDIGTGSGILAIVASKLGAKNVIGVDLDEVAVNVARENVSFNNVNNVEILHGNLFDVINDEADVVVANIIAEIIIGLSEELGKYLKNNGLFIASGIINSKKEDVIETLKKNNFEIQDIMEKGEWVAIVSKK